MSNELNIYNLSGGKSKENEYTINDKLIQLDEDDKDKDIFIAMRSELVMIRAIIDKLKKKYPELGMEIEEMENNLKNEI